MVAVEKEKKCRSRYYAALLLQPTNVGVVVSVEGLEGRVELLAVVVVLLLQADRVHDVPARVEEDLALV